MMSSVPPIKGFNVCLSISTTPIDLNQVGYKLSCVVVVRMTHIFNHYLYEMIRILLVIEFKVVVVQASRHYSFRKKNTIKY